MYPASSSKIREYRRELAPEIHAAWDAFSERVFAGGALPTKTPQLIAVAVAHVTFWFGRLAIKMGFVIADDRNQPCN